MYTKHQYGFTIIVPIKSNNFQAMYQDEIPIHSIFNQNFKITTITKPNFVYETLRGRKAIIKIIVLTPMTSRIHDHNEIKNTTSMTEAGFYDTQIARINWVSFHLYTYRVQFDLVHV